MQNPSLLQRIARNNSNKERIAGGIVSNPGAIPVVLEGLNSTDSSTRFGCSKILRLASEENPEVLYSHMEFFVRMLDNPNTFLRLDAARIIANLVKVDSESKFEKIFEKYFAPIAGPTMIPAATVIGTAARIIQAKPDLTGRIVAEILKVDKAKYATAECRNIASGHAIRSFDAIFDQIEEKAPVLSFVRKQLKNSRAATRKKAEAFVKKHWV